LAIQLSIWEMLWLRKCLLLVATLPSTVLSRLGYLYIINDYVLLLKSYRPCKGVTREYFVPLHIYVGASTLRLVHGRKVQLIFREGTQIIVNVELVVFVVKCLVLLKGEVTICCGQHVVPAGHFDILRISRIHFQLNLNYSNH
jgi:hypothetical protein